MVTIAVTIKTKIVMNRALKKSLLWGGLTLGTAFAMAAAAEWNGYHALNLPNGWNILCAIDPTCRQMTKGEIRLSHELFGDDIHYATVKVFNRSHFGLPLNRIFDWARDELGLKVPDIFGLSPNGNIYVTDPSSYVDDFSIESLNIDSFMHEMTHVWQRQKGINIRRQAADTIIRNNFNYDDVYTYNIESHDEFYAFNFEQQAKIVEHYVFRRDLIRVHLAPYADQPDPLSASGQRDFITANCRVLLPLEDKLRQELPLKAEPLCQFVRDQDPKPAKPPKKRHPAPR
jgi:hypothetical protein